MEKKEEVIPIKIGELIETLAAAILKKYSFMRPIDHIFLAFSISCVTILLAVFVRWLVVTYVL